MTIKTIFESFSTKNQVNKLNSKSINFAMMVIVRLYSMPKECTFR